MLAVAPCSLLVPIFGLILIGIQNERRKQKALLREYSTRLELIYSARGGRR